MFWAIFWTIISKISNAFYAKTTKYEVPAILNELLSFSWAIIWLVIVLLLWKFNILLFSLLDYILIIVSVIIYYFQLIIDKIVYEKEKISKLIPYSNIWSILSVILWILVLWDQLSLTAILIFLATIALILVTSVDRKNLTISKNILLFIWARWIWSISDLITWYVLINNSSLDLFTTYVIFAFIMLLWISFMQKDIQKAKNLPKDYHKAAFFTSISRLSWLITILMIKELWLSMSIILSFLWIWVSLIMSYILFKDIPSKKDLIVTIAVTILIFLAFLLS